MDNYDTPDNIARAMVSLAYGKTLEPAGGLGAIAKHLPKGSHCVEIDDKRIIKGQKEAPHCEWFCKSFLDKDHSHTYDTIISNPPFSLIIPFIQRGLELLNEGGQIIYLIPLTSLSTKNRAQEMQALGGHISQLLLIPGRVDYLIDGIPTSKIKRADGKMMGGRREPDALFIIKPGLSSHNAHGYLEGI